MSVKVLILPINLSSTSVVVIFEFGSSDSLIGTIEIYSYIYSFWWLIIVFSSDCCHCQLVSANLNREEPFKLSSMAFYMLIHSDTEWPCNILSQPGYVKVLRVREYMSTPCITCLIFYKPKSALKFKVN